MCGKRVTQRPFWTPPFARSPASPYSGQKLAVGNPPSYCKHGVLEDDAGVEKSGISNQFMMLRCQKVLTAPQNSARQCGHWPTMRTTAELHWVSDWN